MRHTSINPKSFLRKLQTNIPHESSREGFKNNRKSNAVMNYIYVRPLFGGDDETQVLNTRVA